MNTKFLGKTLVASALVLTTLGTGLHSSYLGLNTNKVVKTAKAEEKMTNGQLWKKVKDSLIDSNIISGNENEEITVTYVIKPDILQVFLPMVIIMTIFQVLQVIFLNLRKLT